MCVFSPAAAAIISEIILAACLNIESGSHIQLGFRGSRWAEALREDLSDPRMLPHWCSQCPLIV